MGRTVALVLFLLLVLLGGCATSPTIRLSGKTISPEMVYQRVKENQERVQSLSGSGTISVESPEMAQSGSFELILRKPDSILVRIEGPFGIRVGSALLTRSEFAFYNSLQNKLITGPVTAGNINRIFRVNLTFDELLDLFTGGSFLPADKDASPDTLGTEENQFVLTYRDHAGSRRYWVDPASLLITRIQHLDVSGKLGLEERFDKFRLLDDALLPRQVRLVQHTTKRIVAVVFSSLSTDVDRAPLVLDIPLNAERVFLR